MLLVHFIMDHLLRFPFCSFRKTQSSTFTTELRCFFGGVCSLKDPMRPNRRLLLFIKRGSRLMITQGSRKGFKENKKTYQKTLNFLQVNSHKDRTWPYIKHSNQLLRSLGCNFPQDKLFCQAFRSWYLFVVVRLGFELGACLTGECPHVGLGLTFFKRSARSCS